MHIPPFCSAIARRQRASVLVGGGPGQVISAGSPFGWRWSGKAQRTAATSFTSELDALGATPTIRMAQAVRGVLTVATRRSLSESNGLFPHTCGGRAANRSLEAPPARPRARPGSSISVALGGTGDLTQIVTANLAAKYHARSPSRAEFSSRCGRWRGSPSSSAEASARYPSQGDHQGRCGYHGCARRGQRD